MESILLVIATAFCMLLFSLLMAALWAKWYPTTLCNTALKDGSKYNVCIKRKNHLGLHMTVNGKEF